jgi:ribosome biogenesis protein Nip4
MFRSTTIIEETVLKREFNKWKIFEAYKNYQIMIKTSENRSILDFDKQKKKKKIKSKINYHKIENTIKDNLKEKDDRDSKVYICSNEEQKEIAIRLQPLHSGICIGEINNKKFKPNLNFAEIIVNQSQELNYPYIVLEENGSKLVLYGRDIMGKSIIDYSKDIKENQTVLILNQTREIIGIGRSRYNNNLLTQNDKITIDNIQDIGTNYLKNENSHKNESVFI